MTIKAMETGKFLRRRNGVDAPVYGVGVKNEVREVEAAARETSKPAKG